MSHKVIESNVSQRIYSAQSNATITEHSGGLMGANQIQYGGVSHPEY